MPPVAKTPMPAWPITFCRPSGPAGSGTTSHAKLSSSGDAQTLTVTAKTLLRDVCLFADRLDPNAQVSDQCVTLLPGETSVRRGRLGDVAESVCLLALVPLALVATGVFSAIAG